MEPEQRADLIPWLEVVDAKKSEVQAISAALTSAARFCRLAYLVAAPWQREVYSELRPSTPAGFTVIPGVRAEHLMPGQTPFHDRGAWHDLAFVAHRLSRVTGLRALVLDVERPLYPYWRGQQELDHAQLVRSLEQMPDLEYLWHPGGLGVPDEGASADVLTRAAACWKSVQAGLRRVKFTTVSAATLPAYGAMPWIARFDAELRAAARVRPQEAIYLDPDGAHFWAYRDIRRPLALLRSRDALLRAADMPGMLTAAATILAAR